jgi:hypothetical protein
VQNSSEVALENAQVQQTLTHPSDVVFYYDEPYSVSRTYVNTDLKSYKKGSISYRAVATAIENLALALECAELSDEWREKFVHESQPYRIIGLLFIYNHDGEYDLGFQEILAKVNLENLKIPRNSRIFVLGPRDIRWLDNVRYDIVSLRGLGRLPISEDKCSFFTQTWFVGRRCSRQQEPRRLSFSLDLGSSCPIRPKARIRPAILSISVAVASMQKSFCIS